MTAFVKVTKERMIAMLTIQPEIGKKGNSFGILDEKKPQNAGGNFKRIEVISKD